MVLPEVTPDHQVIIDPRVDGAAFSGSNHFAPVFRIAALARGAPPLDPELYEDGQVAGYSMHAYAMFQSLCFQHPPDNDRNDQGAQVPHALNVRAVLKPLQVDTRLCEVRWRGGLTTYLTDDGKVVNSVEAFEAGEWWGQEISMSLDQIELVSGQADSARLLFYVRDAWVSFGDPNAPAGSKAASNWFPGSPHEALKSSLLPPYRLALVRDLLVRTGSTGARKHVGKYVLLSGEFICALACVCVCSGCLSLSTKRLTFHTHMCVCLCVCAVVV